MIFLETTSNESSDGTPTQPDDSTLHPDDGTPYKA